MNRTLQNAIMLAYDFHPSEGGIQTLMRSIVSSEIGIDWTVLTRKAADQLDSEGSYKVVRTAIRPQLRTTDRLWLKMRRGRFTVSELIAFQTSRKLIRLGKRTNAVFLIADQLLSAISVRAAARQLGIPWGVFVHGKELLDEDREKSSLLADADFVLANSVFSKDLVIARGANEERVKVLHPAVDTDVFKPPGDRTAVRRDLVVDGQATLLTVAHLVQRKGHEQVIQALPTVKSILPNVVYLVVGRGPHENALRDLAADLDVEDAVRFCGYVPTQDLPLYYGAADIHIMASTCDGDVEGFGISFIEAAACGTPSIGSRSGGIPDAVADGETGILVEPGDVTALSTAIIKIFANEDSRYKMGCAARNTAKKRFSRHAFELALRKIFSQNFFQSEKNPAI